MVDEKPNHSSPLVVFVQHQLGTTIRFVQHQVGATNRLVQHQVGATIRLVHHHELQVGQASPSQEPCLFSQRDLAKPSTIRIHSKHVDKSSRDPISLVQRFPHKGQVLYSGEDELLTSSSWTDQWPDKEQENEKKDLCMKTDRQMQQYQKKSLKEKDFHWFGSRNIFDSIIMRLFQTTASPPIFFINGVIDATEEFVHILPWIKSNRPPSIGIHTSEQGEFFCSSSEISFILSSWHSMHENTIVHVHILQKAFFFNHMLSLQTESPNHKTHHKHKYLSRGNSGPIISNPFHFSSNRRSITTGFNNQHWSLLPSNQLEVAKMQ